jgi:amidase
VNSNFVANMALVPVDPLTAIASDLQVGLMAGKFNSAQLIELYLRQISEHNHYLRSVLKTAPEALLRQEALRLDLERASGNIRGPLHGIPILLKVSSLTKNCWSIFSFSQDNIATHLGLGLETTTGSYALVGSRPRRNANIVERVIFERIRSTLYEYRLLNSQIAHQRRSHHSC